MAAEECEYHSLCGDMCTLTYKLSRQGTCRVLVTAPCASAIDNDFLLWASSFHAIHQPLSLYIVCITNSTLRTSLHELFLVPYNWEILYGTRETRFAPHCA
jgi:hypothetical protein